MFDVHPRFYVMHERNMYNAGGLSRFFLEERVEENEILLKCD